MSSNLERRSDHPRARAGWRGWLRVALLAVVAGLVPAAALAQPANDNFTNAFVLVGTAGTTNGTTLNATVQTGEPFHFSSYRARSVWFRWVAPDSGPVTFDLIGSTFDTIMAAYRGSALGGLTQLASDDDSATVSPYPFDSQITFTALAGTEYRIAVDGFAAASGSYVLNWSQVVCTNVPPGPTEIQFSCVDYAVSESSPGFATVKVVAGGAFPGTVTVDYFTTDGTALVPGDYLSVSNTLTFAPGETNKTFTIIINDNTFQNPNKTVNLTLANPTGGATLGLSSNAVLTIVDDESTPVVSMAGQFNFSMPVYNVTENETVRAPFANAPPSNNGPNRSPFGAVVMVTRTGGAVGRVMVDVNVLSTNRFGTNVTTNTLTQTLVFDDYQMSATFLVSIPQVGNSIINLVLTNARPDVLEDPAIIIPTIGTARSSISVLGVNVGSIYSIERKTYRIDEYDPADPFNTLGLPGQNNSIQFDVLNPSGQSGNVTISTRANLYGYFILDSSDYPESQTRLLPETPYTDGFPGITNLVDYITFSQTLNFGQGVTRIPVTLVVTNDPTVEFNEDIQLQLTNPDNNHTIGNALANVTIMYDDQPAGQADREWNPELISTTQPPFNNTPGANNTVSAVAVQVDGRTILVGDFTAVNSVSRFRIARMNSDGSLDLTFNPGSGADGFVEALALYPASAAVGTNAGKILVAGGFSSINNVSRNGLARLNPNGSLDNSFFVGNGADGFVHTLTLQSDGKVLVSGDFTHWNDMPVAGLMRLNQDGSLDTTFSAGLGPDSTIWSVAVRDAAGTIFAPRTAAGTDFEDVNVIETGSEQGTLVVNYDFLNIPDNIRVFYEGIQIFNLTTNGAGQLTIPYGPGLATDITIIMNQGIGLPGTVWFYTARVTPVVTGRTIFIGGDFTSYDGSVRPGVARLLDNGSIDNGFNPGLGVDGSGSVFAVAIQPDNKLLVGGAFTRFHTSARNSIVRLLKDGSIDPNHHVGTGFNDSVYCITLAPDNKPLLGGIFQEYNSTRRMGLARLLTSGSLDTSFMDTAYNQFSGLTKTYSFDPPRYVNSIALQSDGNLMIGGSFTNVGGNFSVRHGLRNNYTVFTRADKTTRYNITRLIGGYTPGPGNMEFAPSAFPFTIDEGAGIFYATMRRVDGRLGTAQIIATNSSVTASTPDDFINEGLLQTWPEFAYVAPRSVGYVGFNYFAIPITEDVLQEGDETFSVGAVNPTGSITLGGEFIPLGGARGFYDGSTVTVADNDFSHGVFNFHLSAYITNENAGFAIITVIRTNGSSGAVSVDYLTRPGTPSPATTNLDFTPVRGTLSFSPGQTVRTFQVPIVNDALVEFDENVALILTNATGGAKLPGGTPTSIATATLTIIDNDFLQGRLNFSASSFTNNENETFATITVSRTGGNVGAMTVQVRTANGTAFAPADYTATTNTLFWNDGDSAAKSFIIPLVSDGLVEGSEIVNLILYNPAINGALGGRTNATLVIVDGDNFGALTLSQSLYEVDENGTAPVITVNRVGGIAGTVSVSFATSPLPATPSTDYLNNSGTLTFFPGETSHTFVVTNLDDLVPGGDQIVIITLSNPVNGTLGAISNATLTFVDNELINLPAGSVDTTFSGLAAANEAVYALALQPDGGILMAGDFTIVNSVPRNRIARLLGTGLLDETFNIGPGANGSIRALALQNNGRLVVGGLFTTINSTNRNHIARLGTDGSLDAFFNPGAGADNPVYALAIQGDDKILAGGSFSTFNGITRPGVVRLNTNGAVDLNFNPGAGVDGTVYALAVQADGKILLGGEFTSFNGVARTNLLRLNANGTLDGTFNPGFSIDAGVRSIVVQPDTRLLIGGSFTNVNGVTRRGLARLLASGALDATFLNGLGGADSTVLAVKLQIDGKILVAGDFRRFNNVTRSGLTRLRADGTTDPAINFGDGANAFVAALLVQPDRRIIIGGGFTEYDGQPRAHLARIYGGSIDGSGSLEYSAQLFTVGESAGSAIVTVRRRFGTAGEARVDAYTLGGTALPGVDYTGVTNQLIFLEGETRRSLTIPILPNTTPNDDKTVGLYLANFINAQQGPQPLSTLIIVDDDPTIAFSSANYSENENTVSGNATITLTRAGGTNATLTVDIATIAGGTATAGLDYLVTNATLTFGPGVTSRLFNVRLVNDLLLEGNETVLLALSNPGGGATLGLANASLNIVDDEVPNGQFAFATNNFLVDESVGVVGVKIIRTNGSVGIVSVRLTTSNITALAGSDYTPTNRVVTFADGETNKTVFISIINDGVAEPDETVLLTLSAPTGGATISQTNAIITIADDEVVPSYVLFATNNFYFSEDGGVAVITVVRTNSRRGFLTVDFSVSNGTALNGVDYFGTNGTLTFVDGVNEQTFTIPVVNDTEGEGDETVRLSLTNLQGTNSSLVGPTSTLTIVDDDTAFRFSSATYSVAENAGNAVITVQRVGRTNTAVSVSYATALGGTALGGVDYIPVSGVLNWAAGDGAPQTFSVPVIDNNILNAAKTVQLVLSNPTGVATYLGGASNAVLTITDDETVAPLAGPVDPLFNDNFGAKGSVRAVAFDSLQRLYVGGDFTQFHGLAVNRITRLTANGAVDFSFQVGAGANGAVQAIAPVTNGVLIAGAFTNVNGVARGRVARLLLDGSVDATFAPLLGANNVIRALAAMTNGQILIGGDFTSYAGIAAPRLARLNADGTRDLAFILGSGPNALVRAVGVQTNGQILIAGDFTSYNGFLVTRLARLNADGSLDTTFNTGLGADGAVHSIAVGPDGKIIIGGEFLTINGSPRDHVARLHADGSVDTGFDIGLGTLAPVRAVAVERDGHVLVVGDFGTFNGNPSSGVARLNPDGSLDAGFNVGSGADAPVHAISLVTRCVPPPVAVMTFDPLSANFAAQTDYAENCLTLRGLTGGHFHPTPNGAGTGAEIFGVDGTPQELSLNGFAFTLQSVTVTNLSGVVTATSSSGGTVQLTNGVTTFGAGFVDVVWVRFDLDAGAVVILDDVTVIPGIDALVPQTFAIGGDFEKFNQVQRGGVVVLASSGLASVQFDPRNIATRAVYTSAIFTNAALPAYTGKLAVGGDFTAIVGVEGVNHLARLNIDGTLDTTFNSGLGPNGTVRAVAAQPDGKIVFGGLFTSYDFIARAYLGRANADGTLDNTFNFGAGLDNGVLALALQPDGRIVIGGLFSTVYGVSRNGVARMNTNGTVDVSFTVGSGANGPVRAVALQPDGKILIGGDFTTYNGAPRARIARLNNNGSLDTSFNPGTGADGTVNAIALTSGGQVLIGGFNGAPAPRIARLTAAGAVDGTFTPGTGANDYVSSIAVQTDGQVVVGGNFTTFNGQVRQRLVRLNANGTLDPTINFGGGANDFISTITLQHYDGKIVVGGGFTEFDGQTRVAIARLMVGTNSGAGTFRFSSPVFSVNERGSNAVLTVVRSGGTTGAASVNYQTVNGTALAPADYTATSGTLNFANAESMKQILVPVNDNTVASFDRLFIVSLSGATGGATIGAPSNAVVTILENESTFNFGAVNYQVAENGVVARITVTRTGGLLDMATVDFVTDTNGTATAGLDFTARAGTLTFLPGVSSRSFDVTIFDDTVNEFNETVPLRLTLPVGASLGLSNATLTIVENDFGAGVITFRAAAYTGSEDGGGIVVELLRTNGYSGGVTVGYRTLTGSATANVDYLATNGLVSFVDGQTNAFITIYPLDDVLTEGNETVPVQLFNPSAGATLGLANATVTIVDNDSPGQFVFSSPTYTVSEVGGSATITVLRTNGNLGAVSVTAQTSGGSATPSADYQSVSTVLNFAAGQSLRTFTVPIFDDVAPEGVETVGLLLSNPTGGTSIGALGSAVLSIVDNEASVGLASAALSVLEGATNFPVTLVRLGDPNVSFSVTLNTSDGSATAGSDYQATRTTVTFAAGETNRVVSVAILDDALAEGNETVNLTLSSPSAGVGLGPILSGTLTILDNDTGFSFSSATYATNEGTLDLIITVRRLGSVAGVASVDYLTTDGTATAGLDYLTSTGRLAFAAGQTSGLFNVRILDDVLVENNETILLALANPSAGTFLGAQPTAVISILDNDTSVGLSPTAYAVNEKVTNAVITLVRNGAPGQAVTVGFRTQNGTATAGVDYTFTTQTVAWAANDIAPKTVLIPITDDGLAEGTETVTLILSGALGATIDPAAASGVLSIIDDAGVIAFAAANSSAVESSGDAVINLVRTGGSSGVVSVQWNATGGSATAGADYSSTSGFVVFANNETVKPILFPIVDDASVEGIETVNLTLSNPTGGARVGSPASAVLSILDNDSGVIVGAGASLIAESFAPTNNIIDPNETVTLLFGLRNSGTVNAANVTAGLVYANGVTNSAPQTQSYGLLSAGGSTVSRPFTFTALGSNGTRITATLLVTNDGVFFGPVSFDFVLGIQSVAFANAGAITIPAFGQAAPYPAPITVSGVSGPITKITVSLNNIHHTQPGQMDILLVGPNGTAVMLMSDAGTNILMNGVSITFDDAAAAVLPQFSGITSGTYRCTNYPPVADSFNPPFAVGSAFWTNTPALSAFNGTDANGVWSLYVVDDSVGDNGDIAGGWSLNIGTANIVAPGADLAVLVTDSPDPVQTNSTFTYTIGVTNFGPATATAITLTNVLPSAASFVSVAGPGVYTLNGNEVRGTLGDLAAGAGTVVNITMTAQNMTGQLTFTTTVASGTADPNALNNLASIKTTVVDSVPLPLLFAARKNGQLVLSWQSTTPNVALEAVTLLGGSWANAPVTPVVSNGVSTVTLPMDSGGKFYRLKRTP